MPQAETQAVSTASIIRSAEFQRGVADARARRPPRYDDESGWNYEWGRLFAAAAPRDLSVARCTRQVAAIFNSIYFEEKQ